MSGGLITCIFGNRVIFKFRHTFLQYYCILLYDEKFKYSDYPGLFRHSYINAILMEIVYCTLLQYFASRGIIGSERGICIARLFAQRWTEVAQIRGMVVKRDGEIED